MTPTEEQTQLLRDLSSQRSVYSSFTVNRKRGIQLGGAFRCPVAGCGKSFAQNQNLKNHVSRYHEKRRDEPCPRVGCKYAGPNRSNLRSHWQHKHNGAEMPKWMESQGRGRPTLARPIEWEEEEEQHDDEMSPMSEEDSD
jgi:uncharacterized Zn-finger protein